MPWSRYQAKPKKILFERTPKKRTLFPKGSNCRLGNEKPSWPGYLIQSTAGKNGRVCLDTTPISRARDAPRALGLTHPPVSYYITLAPHAGRAYAHARHTPHDHSAPRETPLWCVRAAAQAILKELFPWTYLGRLSDDALLEWRVRPWAVRCLWRGKWVTVRHEYDASGGGDMVRRQTPWFITAHYCQ